ncbi:hypothetical protein KY289_037308 [Solanum tuberosum]|nr:hypothetical protein KY289_037308 [Solanum tuberosum]
MTETRTCEFDHNNNPKKNTRSTEELKDRFSGLPYSGVEDGLSRLPCFGVEDDKGEILEDGFSGLPCSGVEDGLSGLPCFGVEDDKGGILEDGFLEIGKKKRRICEMGRLSDPLVVLGSDVMLMILSCLDARSVALCLLVSCGWRAVASSDKIWSSKCEELWQGKTHLPRIAKVNDLSKLAVYSLSVMDGKRKRIRKEDLYDHVWEFHFTEFFQKFTGFIDVTGQFHRASAKPIVVLQLLRIGECPIPTGMEQDVPCAVISFQMEVRLQKQMTRYRVVMSLATP